MPNAFVDYSFIVFLILEWKVSRLDANKGETTTLCCGVVSQKRRRTADCQMSHYIENYHDALCGVVDFCDATPQRSVVATP